MAEREVDTASIEGRVQSQPGWSLLCAGAVVVVIAGVREASSVVVPVLLAAFFAINLVPLLRLLQRWAPFAVALPLVLLVQVGVFVVVSLGVGGSLQQLLQALPNLQDQFEALEQNVSRWLAQRDVNVAAKDLLPLSSVPVLLGNLVNGVLRTFGDGFLVLLMTAFMLTETHWFSAKLEVIDGADGQTKARVREVLDNVRRYVAVKTVASTATGLLIGLGLSVLGIKYASVWGLLALLLNFVPTIGSIAAGVPPVALALADPEEGPLVALIVLALYGAVNQAIGSVLEPRWLGDRLGLSPLIVLVSLLFWGWVLGPIGMLLSAPITMAVKIGCEEYSQTRWIAVLLGGSPPKPHRATPPGRQERE